MAKVDVRHEQAAAMMAHAYSRVTGKPGVCMGAGGPGALNLLTGIANAYLDACPILALGGASSFNLYDLGDFQELDQVAVFKPVCKWAARIYEARRAKEYVHFAMVRARHGKPGPVYLDMPGNMLYEKVDESRVALRPSLKEMALPSPDNRLNRAGRRDASDCRKASPSHRERHFLVRCGRGNALVRGDHGDSLLHEPSGARDGPRRSSALLPRCPFFCLSRGRRGAGGRHPLQLYHRSRAAAALLGRCEIHLLARI